MEYLLMVMKHAPQNLVHSLRDLADAGRVWLQIIGGVGVVVLLLWLLGAFRRR
jgi:hypothetical protein